MSERRIKVVTGDFGKGYFTTQIFLMEDGQEIDISNMVTSVNYSEVAGGVPEVLIGLVPAELDFNVEALKAKFVEEGNPPANQAVPESAE
jgi:hypothetical protein